MMDVKETVALKMMVIVYILFDVDGKPFDDDLSTDKYIISNEIVNVEQVETGTRSKRHKRNTVPDFPSSMTFRLQMSFGNVTLNLEKNENIANDIPFYTIDSHSRITPKLLHSKRNSALYQDVELSGSILVKFPTENLTSYKLLGAFTYNGSNYHIKPLENSDKQTRTRKRRQINSSTITSMITATPASDQIDNDEKGSHSVERQEIISGTFEGDTLIAPSTSGEQLYLSKQGAPYPRKSHKENATDVPFLILEGDPITGKHMDGKTTETSTGAYYFDKEMMPPDTASTPATIRGKRATDSLYVEYMVVCDYKNIEGWKTRVGGDSEEVKLNNAFEALYEYYQFVVNGIDVRFRTAKSSGSKIRVVFAAILVSTDASTSPWTTLNKIDTGKNAVDDAGVLLDFATWKRAVYNDLPRHDHAALFTGFDLATPSSLSTLGMAYLNSVCSRMWAVSENEETFNAIAIHIAAHELGHNIGSRHDGSANDCSSDALYLMAPRLPVIRDRKIAENPWKFSSCSRSSIDSFVKDLGRDSCLQNVPNNLQPALKPAGLVYSPDEQCNMTYGGGARFCRDHFYQQWDRICFAMQCKKKGASSCTGSFFPFQGTPCGDKKWCQAGMCVSSPDAPSSTENCPYGDDPLTNCNKNSCGNFFKRTVTCCDTCSRTTTKAPSTTTRRMTTEVSSTPVTVSEQTAITTLTKTSRTTSISTKQTTTAKPTRKSPTTATTQQPTTTKTTDQPTSATSEKTTTTEKDQTKNKSKITHELKTMIALFMSMAVLV